MAASFISSGGASLKKRDADYAIEECVHPGFRFVKRTIWDDLITSPAYIVMKAAGEFKDKTTAPNQLW